MNITITRGDTEVLTFKIVDANGENYVLKDADKLYFTIKNDWRDKECVLQKTIGNGITYNADTGEYEIELTQECTCNMCCRPYEYDIELVLDSQSPKVVKTLVKGEFVVEKEITHKGNEQ